jgi:hypothetical protein
MVEKDVKLFVRNTVRADWKRMGPAGRARTGPLL